MYTGNLINELIETVDRVGERLEQQRIAAELHEIFTMQIPVANGENAFMGAA